MGSCLNDGSPFDKDFYDPHNPSYTDLSTGDTCLIRDIDYISYAGSTGWCWFDPPGDLINIIGATNNYGLFDGTLEGFPHAAPHVCVKYNMASFSYSPDDPIFFLHHTFIDYLWALWQDCWNYDGASPITSNMFSPLSSLTYSLAFTPYTTTT